MTFGEKLAKLRKENNYTQEQLADMLNVSRQSVSKWESNMAYPETDKLICLARLFDCSTDYLLKDECVSKERKEDRTANEESVPVKETVAAKNQKIMGYILLAVSLIAGVLVPILAESKEGLFISLSFLFAILVCGLICIFVKRKAGYWCAWAIAAPLVLLAPNLVSLPILTASALVLVCFSIIMVFVANKVFDNEDISAKRKKGWIVVVGWIVLIGWYMFSFIACALGLMPYILMNLSAYAGGALLITYTVCYVKEAKRNKK